MPEVNRPNILYIHSHDTGRYVQPYGHAVPTPNIQRLAEEGVLFRRAFCANPTCSPSRACLLTGQYAHNNGMLGLAHRGFRLNDMRQHIIHTLRAAGYYSAHSGLQHVAANVDEIGYDDVLQGRAGADIVSAAAADFLRSAPPQPFFLDVGYFETHRVFPEHDPRDDPRYSLPPHPIPDAPRTRLDMARYKTCVRRLDEGIGTVLAALEETGLAGNTLVICTTDHGIAFPTMKCNLTDHGLGVMLIMRGPGGFAGGDVIDAMVSQIDLFPTICDLLEMGRPPWLQGTSILPLVRGEAEAVREEIFAEINYHAAYDAQRCARTSRWKYIRRFDGRTRRVLSNVDPGLTRDWLLEQGWRDQQLDAEALYDLVFDANEMRNLAKDPAMCSVLEEMRGRLDRWMHETNDPILNGPIPAPKGARLNDPDGLSPKEPATIVQ